MESMKINFWVWFLWKKEELQSKIIKHGTIFKLESGEMESGDERQLRICHHANKRKVDKYYQGEAKNSLIIFKV